VFAIALADTDEINGGTDIDNEGMVAFVGIDLDSWAHTPALPAGQRRFRTLLVVQSVQSEQH